MWRQLRLLCFGGGLWLLLAACGTQPVRQGAYTVKSGDTLYSIAWRHEVDYRELAKLNNIGSDYRIYPGQVLRLSKATPLQKLAAVRAPPTARPWVVAPVTNIKWQWPSVANSYAATTRPNGGVGLVVNGQIGQDIVAAATGRVVYTGSGLLGYGQLIIVKHDEVYLSAYGHLQTAVVREGEQVMAGQKIAIMGNDPAGAPALYFEIRVNGQPTDPLPLLPTPRQK